MLVKESLSRDVLRLMVWYPIRWLVIALPVSWGFALFRLMGDIHYSLSGGKKNILFRNLKPVLGDRLSDRELSDTVRKYFRNHYVNQLQILLFPRLGLDNLAKVHVFEGLENLEQVVSKGKGCILMHPHFGPAQLPLCALGIMGYPMMQLGLPVDESLSFIGRKVVFRLRVKYESKIPAQIVSADSFLRPVIKWLKDNGVLMVTGDGAGGGKLIGKFIPLEFLGESVLFPIGAATLARKTGLPVLPMFTVIEQDNSYKTIIHKPIVLEAGNEEQSTHKLIAGFAKIMEDYIYRFPYLWHFWDEFADRITKGKVNKPADQA